MKKIRYIIEIIIYIIIIYINYLIIVFIIKYINLNVILIEKLNLRFIYISKYL